MKRRSCSRLVAQSVLIAVAVLALFSTATAATWNEKVLYSFQGGSDGQVPAGGVVFDTSGNLYGTTAQGGADNCSPTANCGTVFELSPPAKKGDPWTETVLYVFKGKKFNDGDTPTGGLVLDAAGNLYGVTAYGGTGNCQLAELAGCGLVFELSPPLQKGGAWTETILYSFQSGNDGYLPWGNLTWDAKGNLYGATDFGGGKGNTCNVYYQFCGTVFKLSPPKQKGGKWTERVLHSFGGGKDGANPNGGLVLDKQGAIYGTTVSGGNQKCADKDVSIGCGTLFKLSPPKTKGAAWTEKLLHVFTGDSDGRNPDGGPVLDAEGSVYGTAGGGRPTGGGIVFRLSATSGGRWKETVLHWSSDAPPLAGVTFHSDGNLYGTAIGGPSNCGLVFQLRHPVRRGGSWAFTALYSLKGGSDGRYPSASVIFDHAGNLYSTSQGGGSSAGYGTVFELTP